MPAIPQMDLPLPAAWPQFWIAKPCRHWSAAQNRRFCLYRLDGPSNHVGKKPGAVWDADERVWRDQAQLGGISGHDLARPARADELPADPVARRAA